MAPTVPWAYTKSYRSADRRRRHARQLRVRVGIVRQRVLRAIRLYAHQAAVFGGVSPNRLVVFCLGTSGLLAGLAGLFEVTGPGGQITTDFNQGYGFTAIIVAFLGRLHPIGILLRNGKS